MLLAARTALVLLVKVNSALIFLAYGAQCAGESEYWDTLSVDDVIEEDLNHVWPNRYWEALHGHARCIPDYYGHCVPMELMNRICEFNRRADLGGWDNLGVDALQIHLHVEHGLRVETVSLSKISPDETALGWNMIAQPTAERDRMPCVSLSNNCHTTLLVADGKLVGEAECTTQLDPVLHVASVSRHRVNHDLP